MMSGAKLKSFQIDHRLLVDKLNINNNFPNSIVILWNKYQIFVYENYEFDKPTSILENDFTIYDIILSANYFICLDYNQQIHVIPMTNKSPVPKKIKRNTKTHHQGIVAITQLNQDQWYSLYISENVMEKWKLYLNRNNGDLVKSVKIANKLTKDICRQQDIILKCLSVQKEHHTFLKQIFNKDIINMDNNNLLIVMLNNKVYFGLHNTTIMDDITVKIVFTAPIDITDIQVSVSDIFIVMKLGTYVRLPLICEKDNKSVESNNLRQRFNTVHLNVKFHKITFTKSSVIFTDGIKLWSSKMKGQKVDKNISNWKDFNIPLPKDFIIVASDIIICVTYTNKVYVFSEEKQNSNQITNRDYKKANNALNNIKDFYPIIGALNKNEQLCNELKFEKDLLVTMILSTREKFVQEMLSYKVLVYENYTDVIKENKNIHMCSETCEYFESNTIMFLVKVLIIDRNTLNQFVKSILQNLKLHLTVSSNGCSLKTVSVAITSLKEDMNVLVCIHKNNLTNATININLVPILPGAIDPDKKLPVILSKKDINIKSHHFIRSSASSDCSIIGIKNTSKDVKESVLKIAKNFHTLFNIIERLQSKKNDKDYNTFLKLPKNYLEQLCKEANYSPHFNEMKTKFLLNKLSSNDFLQSENPVVFQIHDHKVNLQINTDDGDKMLCITSKNIKIAYDFRNLFSSILYGNYENSLTNREFVPQASYAIIEDLERSLKSSICDTDDEETILELAEQFHKNVIGRLPL